MRAKNHARRLAVIFLIAVVLFAVMAHGGTGIGAAILIPLAFCSGAIVCLAAPRLEERIFAWRSSVLRVFSPRPPPTISR